MSRFSLVRLLVMALLVSSLPVFAQNITGQLSGTVTDQSGAVVPNAKVTLTDQATNTTRDTTSNGSGTFSFAAVEPATYTLSVTAAGFTTWEQKNIQFTQAANITIPNINLQVGTSSQVVEVVSAAEVVVPSDNGQSSQTLNEHMINELAIQGRDAAELIKIMPGMGNNNGLSNSMWNSLTTANNSGPIGAFSANGTQPNGGMTMTMDGANLLDPGNQGTQTANVNQNQISEVSIFTSAYDASFAKGPITFQAIGKSGGAHFHGQAYFYARNGVLNSEDSLLKNEGQAKPQDSYYYPGGDFGGPVLLPFTHFNRNHDKLFFYGAYENMRQNPSGSLISRFIPTADMMGQNPNKPYLDFTQPYLDTFGSAWSGLFASGNTPTAQGCSSGTTGCIPAEYVNQYVNGAGLYSNTAGAGYSANPNFGKIPLSFLDPNSLALWKLMPAPNVDPATHDGYNYETVLNQPVNRWELRLRGDYNISDKHHLYFSWTRQDETDLNPISVWWYMGNAIPYPSSMTAAQQSNVYSANLTSSFSPTLTNEIQYGQAKFINPIALGNAGAVNPANVGFQLTGLFKDPYTPQLPNTENWNGGVPGYSAPTFGTGWQGGDFGKYSNAPSIADNLTKVWGTHTVKVGFYWDQNQNLQTTGGWNSGPQGTVEFEPYGATSTNNEFTNFATGHITSFTQSNAAPITNYKDHEYSFYVNDSWKVIPRLTLTLGARADHIGAWDPQTGAGNAVWDPATYNNTCTTCAWTGLEWHGIDPSIPMSGVPSKPFFFEPRFGMAYDLFGNGKTILRGGFGVYRYQIAYNTASGAENPGLGVETETTVSFSGNGCCIGYNNFAAYSPSLGAAGLGSSVSGIMVMGNERTPYTESYNFTISQQGPWKSLIEVSYNGNQSHDLLSDAASSNLDLVPFGAYYQPDPLTGRVNSPFSTSFPTADYLPYHQYSELQLVENQSYQNYNSIQASWQKQTGHATFTTNYTFGKVLGIRDGETDNGNGNGTLVDPYNLNANYGVLAYDHTHIFNAAYVINLPSPIHGNKFAAGAVNGWELSGITQLQSGAPIQPNVGGNLNVQYGNIVVPGQNLSSTTGQPQPFGVGAQSWLGTDSVGILPQITCDPRSNLKSGQYFNPSCFTVPAFGSQGDIIWPYIHGPAFFNSDLSLYKNFAIHESQKIQLRFEAFNFINHPLPEFNANGNGDVRLSFISPTTAANGSTLATTNQNSLTSGFPAYTVGRRVLELAIKYEF